MRALRLAVALLASSAGFAADPPPKLTDAPKPPAGFPSFKIQEIDAGLKIGYAVIAVDIDGDKKLDIVVVDQHKVVWYQNPTWQKRVILDGKTKPDNVCIAAIDIDGDGLPELVLGAGWKPFDTTNPGTLQWLKRGKTLDDEWTMHKLPCAEPTVHRVRAFDIDGDGKPEIVHVPLMGADSTAAKNWQDGRPSRVMALKVPAKDPEKTENWKPEVLSDELRVCHNFTSVLDRHTNPKSQAILVGSYDGVSLIHRGFNRGKWTTSRLHEANQADPKGSRGASEIKRAEDGTEVIATVEPWHGNQVVVYAPVNLPKPVMFIDLKRTVIDDHLRWGHGVAFADLDGDGKDELVIGVRDNPAKGDPFTEKRGVRIYKRAGEKWERYILDDGGVAVEDLVVADLDGDGKPDIVAVGRATGNCRIYWNQGK